MLRWVVVGGGSAGCVVASRLSEDSANDVTLIEAGPDHGPVPAERDFGPLHQRPDLVHQRSIVPRGFGLGGTSLINGTLASPDRDHPGVIHRLPITAADPARLGPLGGALLASCDDARLLEFTRESGRRITVADAYLSEVGGRPNLRVMTNTEVLQIVVESRRAVGVITDSGIHVPADRVVVSAGAIGTPELLLRSEIDTPGIGEGLQNHAAVAILVELAGPVDPNETPMFATVLDRPPCQVLPLNFLPDRVMANSGVGAVLTALMHVETVGSVTLPDLDGPPKVRLEHLVEQSDLDRLTIAVRETLVLLEHPAFRQVTRRLYLDDSGTPVSSLAQPEGIRAWFEHNLSAYHHYSSTCRIGVVTDQNGSVNGYEGLLVCDASLFPGVPAVNPYISVITQAERLVADWRTPHR